MLQECKKNTYEYTNLEFRARQSFYSAEGLQMTLITW